MIIEWALSVVLSLIAMPLCLFLLFFFFLMAWAGVTLLIIIPWIAFLYWLDVKIPKWLLKLNMFY
jgi:hypothetical protein